MESSPHRIRSQRWQVRAGLPEEAFVWREFLREQGEALLMPLLDRAFSEVTPPGEVLHIPRLFLEVKASSPDDLAALLPGLLRRQLAAQLRPGRGDLQAPGDQPLIRRETAVAQSRLGMLLHYLRSGTLPWQEAPTTAGDAGRVAELLRQTCCDELPQLIELLRHERLDAALFFRLLQLLPDSEVDSAAVTLFSALLPAAFQERQMTTRLLALLRRCALPRQRQLYLLAGVLAAKLGGSGGSGGTTAAQEGSESSFGNVCQALLHCLEDDEAFSFLQALGATLPLEAGSILLRLGSLLFGSRVAGLDPFSGRALLAALADVALRRGNAADGSDPAAEMIAVVRAAGESLTSALFSALMQPQSAAGIAAELPGKPGAESMGGAAASEKPSPTSGAMGSCKQETLPAGRTAYDQGHLVEDGEWVEAAQRMTSQRQTPTAPAQLGARGPGEREETGGNQTVPLAGPHRDTAPLAAIFPLLVNQAGLLLLHPYIARFLVRSSVLTQGDTRLQPAVLSRTAALLHHLVSGGDEPYEFELGLIKVLLGLRPETPLPVATGLLTDRDRQEAVGLLQSVVGYWRALKNTSIDGLRSSFLQRSGLLREAENGWQLRVERRPFDLLLEQLPWGFGVVKLPWMPRAIFTEW